MIVPMIPEPLVVVPSARAVAVVWLFAALAGGTIACGAAPDGVLTVKVKPSSPSLAIVDFGVIEYPIGLPQPLNPNSRPDEAVTPKMTWLRLSY